MELSSSSLLPTRSSNASLSIFSISLRVSPLFSIAVSPIKKLIPSFSSETDEFILSLFAGSDAKVRLERKRLLAHFRSLPGLQLNNTQSYDSTIDWAANVGGALTGTRTAANSFSITYKYRIRPEESPNQSYREYSGLSRRDRLTQAYGIKEDPTELERPSYTDRYCYKVPNPPTCPTNPEPLTHQVEDGNLQTHTFGFPRFQFFQKFGDSLSYYHASSPIPAAYHPSKIGWQPARKITSITEETPEINTDSVQYAPPTAPTNSLQPRKKKFRELAILDIPDGSVSHLLPSRFNRFAHTSCFPPAALPRRRRDPLDLHAACVSALKVREEARMAELARMQAEAARHAEDIFEEVAAFVKVRRLWREARNDSGVALTFGCTRAEEATRARDDRKLEIARHDSGRGKGTDKDEHKENPKEETKYPRPGEVFSGYLHSFVENAIADTDDEDVDAELKRLRRTGCMERARKYAAPGF
ncbi:hypothetical protein B0O99DRAFT_743616 [Bisporella sp. PMI_857]|nr:hypothetical protein B0O99DRAFT_743616 [Bisporella sp. PMI_857]